MKYKILNSISEIIDSYNYFLLDLWGVIHDGQELYPGVMDALKTLREKEKKVVFLSNAPRRAEVVQEVLSKMRITPGMYIAVITSGEAAFTELKRNPAEYLDSPEKTYYYLGPEKDLNVLMGLGLQRVGSLEKAGFVVCTGFEEDDQKISDLKNTLSKMHAANLQMICLNPDLQVVRKNGDSMDCAGVIANQYANIGGKVAYFGKPYPVVYLQSIEAIAKAEKIKISEVDKSKIIAVGDGIRTDIRGANDFGIDSTYVTGGILKMEMGISEDLLTSPKVLDKLFKSFKVTPQYVIKGFNLGQE